MKISTHTALQSREFGDPLSEQFWARPNTPRRVLRSVVNAIGEWRRRARARRQFQSLCELDDRALRDIGLTASQLNFEASRPICWR
jgi:uncharacterized protein YjiS (DUF1127 family)